MFTHSVRGMFWRKRHEAICNRFRDIDFRVSTLKADCGATMRPIPELTSQVDGPTGLLSNTVERFRLTGLQAELWADMFQRYSKGRCHKWGSAGQFGRIGVDTTRLNSSTLGVFGVDYSDTETQFFELGQNLTTQIDVVEEMLTNRSNSNATG